MSKFKITVAALGAALLLASCGGGGGGETVSKKAGFTALVSFGDSLSDVGTYKVGTVAALGGGKYTVNGASGKNWTELIAADLGLPAPCSAQTGLDGMASQGFSVPPTNHAGCTNYAQGGARVTNPVGPGNKMLGGANAILGQLTVPVVTQIANHLAASGGSFSGKELVTVMAGGNDVFINFAVFAGSVQAGMSPTAAATAAATAMGQAGAELAGYVKSQILGKGAKQVVVVNLPDVSKTPFGYSIETSAPGVINAMVQAFNAQLSAGLSGATVTIVDAYTEGRAQAANPAQYGVTNSTTPACNLAPAANPLGSSLVCNSANVITGDISHYYFADSVHPTPYGYQLLAQLVSRSLAQAGWL